ncbi:MAG: LysR family transcriptional regulator [bacterium]
MDIHLKLRILTKDGEPFMGPGPLRLLQGIREHRSINQAAAAMDLSYVKALQLVNRLEKCLGHQLLLRTRGGAQRGGTELTPFAERFLAEYARLQAALDQRANSEFEVFRRNLELEA